MSHSAATILKLQLRESLSAGGWGTFFSFRKLSYCSVFLKWVEDEFGWTSSCNTCLFQTHSLLQAEYCNAFSVSYMDVSWGEGALTGIEKGELQGRNMFNQGTAIKSQRTLLLRFIHWLVPSLRWCLCKQFLAILPRVGNWQSCHAQANRWRFRNKLWDHV